MKYYIEFRKMIRETSFLYWYKPKPKFRLIPRPINVGDALSVYIVWHVMNEKRNIFMNCNNKLLAIGSILNHAKTNDVIWGSGYNSSKKLDTYKFDRLTVHAVRGPLTKVFLESRGVEVPSCFGDPGLLVSRYIKFDDVRDLDYIFYSSLFRE